MRKQCPNGVGCALKKKLLQWIQNALARDRVPDCMGTADQLQGNEPSEQETRQQMCHKAHEHCLSSMYFGCTH